MFKGKKKEKKLHPYKMGVLSFIPVWLKIFLIKWWFVGMTFFFLGFGGAGLFAPNSIEQLFAIGAVIGLLNSFIVSSVIRDISRLDDEHNPYLSVRREGPVGTITNVLLAVLIVIIIRLSYVGINILIITLFSLSTNRVPLPVEPFGFALLFMGYDFLWRKLTFRREKNDDIKKPE